MTAFYNLHYQKIHLFGVCAFRGIGLDFRHSHDLQPRTACHGLRQIAPASQRSSPHHVEQHRLKRPFYVQYVRWVKEVSSGNWGYSVVAAKPVWQAFWYYFPITLELNLFTMPIIILLGIWLGTISGIYRDTWVDHLTRIFAIIGWSLPTFLFALIILMVFYGYLDLFSTRLP